MTITKSSDDPPNNQSTEFAAWVWSPMAVKHLIINMVTKHVSNSYTRPNSQNQNNQDFFPL